MERTCSIENHTSYAVSTKEIKKQGQGSFVLLSKDVPTTILVHQSVFHHGHKIPGQNNQMEKRFHLWLLVSVYHGKKDTVERLTGKTRERMPMLPDFVP